MWIAALFAFALVLTASSVRAQLPGSGGSGGGYPGSGGSPGGTPGSGGYPGSGGSPSVSPAWKVHLDSTGTLQTTDTSGTTHTLAWNTAGEYQYSSVTVYQRQSASVQTSGTYNVRIVWEMPDGTPADTTLYPPPKNVLVDTYSTMSWAGPANSSSGSADNGLNSPLTPASGSPTQYGYMQGEKFTVRDGSSGVISDTISVSANAGGTMNTYGSSVVGVTRNLNVSVNSIWLRVEGTTLDASNQNNILIGQECEAGVFTLAPGTTLQNYHWSVSGDVFNTFSVSSDQQHGHMIACDPTIWSKSDPSWTWRDATGAGALNDTKTVSVSADVYVSGQFIKTIQDSLPVTVWAPYSKMNGYSSSVIYIPGSIPGQGQYMVAAQTVNLTPGMQFVGSVGTPDLFTGGGDTGQWCYVQLLWLNRILNTADNTPIGIGTNSALDNYDPYVLSPYPSYYAADSQSNIHTEGKEKDSPHSGLNNIISYSIKDKYKMWMLYEPPGGQVVPIQSLTWHWNVSGSRPSPTVDFSPDPPNGSVTPDGGQADSVFPEWDTLFTSS